MKWISVQYSLPKEDLPVLVYGRYNYLQHKKEVLIGIYEFGDIYTGDGFHVLIEHYEVAHLEQGITHWMYLPEPPEEEK